MSTKEWDLTAMERIWASRRRAVAQVTQRTDRTGMTRPARDPEERRWLASRGELPEVTEINGQCRE
jgi:hypothetical protein